VIGEVKIERLRRGSNGGYGDVAGVVQDEVVRIERIAKPLVVIVASAGACSASCSWKRPC
jgi:hypothetical protein